MKMTLRVADVLDGGTFVTNNQQTVLLRGVVAPALLSVVGRRAKARLEELILHKHVECDDVTDDSDRHLIVDLQIDGQNVNEIMRKLIGSPEPATDAKAEPEVKKVEIQIDESAFGVRRPTQTPPLKYPPRQ